MNKTMIKTAGLVLAAAMLSSAAFANSVSPSSSAEEKASVIRTLENVELMGTISGYDSSTGLLTIKMYNKDTVSVNVGKRTNITIESYDNTSFATASDFSKGDTVKVYMDGNLNAKSVLIYNY